MKNETIERLRITVPMGQSENINVRVSAPLLEEIKEQAAEQGATQSFIIRDILNKHFFPSIYQN